LRRAHLIASSVVIIHCWFLVLFAKHDEAKFVSFVIYVNMTALRSWHGSASAPPIVV
jgi:hypothetical protein